MPPIRTSDTPGHEAMVARTLVKALRAVFTSDYYDDQFKDLRVVTEYPQSKIKIPSIEVTYDSSLIENAGIGHIEMFPADDGVLREWKHRRFEGQITFRVHAQTPMDRNILADALMEILSFASLDALIEEFLDVVYGEDNSSDDILTDGPIPARAPVDAYLSQLSLNTDQIRPQGKQENLTPWMSEDAYDYTIAYGIEAHGGVYNRYDSDASWELVSKVDIKSREDTDSYDVDDLGPWSFPFTYEDQGVAEFTMTPLDSVTSDEETVDFSFTASALEILEHWDDYVVRMHFEIDSIDTRTKTDADTVSFTLTPSGSDTRTKTDADTVSFTLTPVSTAESHIIIDADTVTFTFEALSNFIDAATASFTLTPSTEQQFGEFVDAATASFTMTPSGSDTRTRTDAAIVTFTLTPSAVFTYTDAATMTATFTAQTLEEYVAAAGTTYNDAATASFTLTPSAVEVYAHLYTDADTVSFAMSPSASEIYSVTYTDAATCSFSMTPMLLHEHLVQELYSTTGGTKGLVAFWKLNEAANTDPVVDSVGGYDGTFVQFGTSGSLPTVQLDGPTTFHAADKSVSFPKAASQEGGGIDIPYNAALNPTSEMSVAAWVKPVGITLTGTPNATAQEIVFYSNRKTGGGTQGQLCVVLYQYNSLGNLQKLIYLAGSTTPASVFVAANLDFTHVGFTRSGSTVKFYIDGVLITTASSTYPNTNVTVKSTIGYFYLSNSNASTAYKGIVGSVELRDHALGDSDFTARYNSGVLGYA